MYGEKEGGNDDDDGDGNEIENTMKGITGINNYVEPRYSRRYFL